MLRVYRRREILVGYIAHSCLDIVSICNMVKLANSGPAELGGGIVVDLFRFCRDASTINFDVCVHIDSETVAQAETTLLLRLHSAR